MISSEKTKKKKREISNKRKQRESKERKLLNKRGGRCDSWR
jgi:hypothetical protein